MPSPLYLLDTNVVLHLVRGSALGQHLASAIGLLDPVNRPSVGIVTHGELLVIAGRTAGATKMPVVRVVACRWSPAAVWVSFSPAPRRFPSMLIRNEGALCRTASPPPPAAHWRV
jgi:hypothetical protein